MRRPEVRVQKWAPSFQRKAAVISEGLGIIFELRYLCVPREWACHAHSGTPEHPGGLQYGAWNFHKTYSGTGGRPPDRGSCGR